MDKFGLLLFLASITFHTGLLFGIYRLLRLLTSHTEDKDLWNAANWLVSALQAIFATGIGLVSVSLSGTDMLYIRLPFLKPFAWFSLGYWIYDLVCLFLLVTHEKQQKEEAEQKVRPPGSPNGRSWRGCFSLLRNILSFVRWWPGIVFHHLVIATFLVIGILTTSRVRGDSIVGYSLLMELSSIFVALRSALGKLSLKESPWYLAVSIAMIGTFFLCRILLMPAVVHLYCSQLGVGYLNAVLSLPFKCKLGTSSFYLLNLYWFSLMIRGAVKVYKKKVLKIE